MCIRDRVNDEWIVPEVSVAPDLATNHMQWNKVDMLDRCFETMQATLAKYKTAGYEPDVEINIDSSLCGSQEFHRAQHMIEQGRLATLQALHLAEPTS